MYDSQGSISARDFGSQCMSSQSWLWQIWKVLASVEERGRVRAGIASLPGFGVPSKNGRDCGLVLAPVFSTSAIRLADRKIF